jgi:pSer/pThr/pTyr-binding forkhead associated (FHA) protein
MQDSSSFRLIVRRGPQPNQIYDLNKGIITLGRDITNDIVINDPEVSRHHCRLTQGGGGYTIEDLGSTNGTFINGQRLTGHPGLRVRCRQCASGNGCGHNARWCSPRQRVCAARVQPSNDGRTSTRSLSRDARPTAALWCAPAADGV